MKIDVAAEECVAGEAAAFETNPARRTNLGNLPIWRALPARRRRLIGPWCFLDRYGPLSFTDDKPMDVAPHPHIGLQTVSWLVDGEVAHHDTLGCEGVVRPGGVNVMTAGRGIAHSEETPRRNRGRLDGVQLWVALPHSHREIEPAFHAVESVPALETSAGIVRIFLGEHDGTRSPAPVFSDAVGIDAAIHDGQTLELPLRAEREHGVMVLAGDLAIEGRPLDRHAIHYLGCGRTALGIRAREDARVLIIGGTPFPERILMWWNFVARTPGEIAAARRAWEEGEFGDVRGYDGPRLEAPPLARLSPPNPAS